MTMMSPTGLSSLLFRRAAAASCRRCGAGIRWTGVATGKQQLRRKATLPPAAHQHQQSSPKTFQIDGVEIGSQELIYGSVFLVACVVIPSTIIYVDYKTCEEECRPMDQGQFKAC